MSKTTIEHESVEEPAGGAMPPAASDGQLVAMLVDWACGEGLQLTGESGLLQQLTKRVLESVRPPTLWAMRSTIQPGRTTATGGTALVGRPLTDVGLVEVRVPPDTAGSFDPQIIKKRQRRLHGVDEIVLSLSAKGLTHGEISEHLAEVSRPSPRSRQGHGWHGRMAEPAA